MALTGRSSFFSCARLAMAVASSLLLSSPWNSTAEARSVESRSPASRSEVTRRRPAQSANEKSARPPIRTPAQNATVKTDGAIIYSEPNFDANQLATLPSGKKVRISRKTVGEMVQFYKIRVGKKIGYIADIDVAVEGQAKKSARSQRQRSTDPKAAQESSEARERSEREKDKEKLPIYFSRFVGVLLGQVAFKESITGVDANENLLIYGLKVTGPDVLMAGPVIDFNLALHYGAPSYYDRLSAIKPTGFLILTDALLVFPFHHRQNRMAYLAGGPLLMYSNFKVLQGDRLMDLSALNLGASFALGGAMRFDQVTMRLEGKYFMEKQSYYGFQLAIQAPF